MVHTKKDDAYITNYTVHIVSATLYLWRGPTAAAPVKYTLSTTTLLRQHDEAAVVIHGLFAITQRRSLIIQAVVIVGFASL